MKTKLLLLAILFPCILTAQGKFSKDSIPVTDKGVEFRVEFKDLPISGEEIRKRVLMYLSTSFEAYSGRLLTDDSRMVVCDAVDSLLYKKQALAVYCMYMRYKLTFEYADGYCLVDFRDLDFMEREDYEVLTGQRRPDTRGSMSPVSYSAREIMVDKSYKTLFVKGASDLITECALSRINEVVDEIGKLLTVNNANR